MSTRPVHVAVLMVDGLLRELRTMTEQAEKKNFPEFSEALQVYNDLTEIYELSPDQSEILDRYMTEILADDEEAAAKMASYLDEIQRGQVTAEDIDWERVKKILQKLMFALSRLDLKLIRLFHGR